MFDKNAVLYQLVTDRFDNVDGTLVDKVGSFEYNENFSGFLGGTFDGARRNVSYIKDLGATHVLISPVQESDEYHGYHQKSSFDISSRFGGAGALKDLIDTVHDNGMRMMLDYVPTHVSFEHSLFRDKVLNGNLEDRDWFIFKDKISEGKYHSYFSDVAYKLTSGNLADLDSVNSMDYLGYFGLKECPLLNLENPEVFDWHRKVLSNLLDNFGFDDVRLDSGFIQPRSFIGALEEVVSSFGGNVVAEYWSFDHSREKCYGFSSGEFDIESTLLFNNDVGSKDFFSSFLALYHSSRDLFEDHSFVLSIDNHDLPRFSKGKNFQKIAAALQFASPFTPLIYYGNEIGMAQYNNGRDRLAQSRDVMRWDLRDEDMLSFYRRLSQFRRNNDFSDATISFPQINDDGLLFTYKLNLGEKKYCVFLNAENRAKPVNVEHLFNEKLTLGDRDILSGKVVNLDSSYFDLDPVSAYLVEDFSGSR